MDSLPHSASRAGRRLSAVAAVVALLGALPALAHAASAGLALNPDNPRYLTWNGKPIYLVGNGFYYSVSNAGFDYGRYFDEMARSGINYTRTWILLPIRQRGEDGSDDDWRWGRDAYPVRYVSPWERSGEGAAYDGEPRYRLDRFDPAYWKRLRGYLSYARKRRIVVELTFFDDCYIRHGHWDDSPHWEYHPFNSINGGPIVADSHKEAAEFYNLENDEVRGCQEALVEKALAETRGFENVIFEVCNEPYSRSIPWEWMQHWVDFIHARDDRLVSIEMARGAHPKADIRNMHLRWAGRVHREFLEHVGDGKPLIADETPGYRGPRHDPEGAAAHRRAMWAAFVTGGHYNLLDYTWYRNPEYADGGEAVRRWQGHLAEFVHRVVPWAMAPRDDLVVSAPAKAFALADPGKHYVVYLMGDTGPSEISVTLDAGRYRVQWFDPKTGEDGSRLTLNVPVGGAVTLASPGFSEDMVLLIRRPLDRPTGKTQIKDWVPWRL